MKLQVLLNFKSENLEQEFWLKDRFINKFLSLKGVKGISLFQIPDLDNYCGCKINYKPCYRRTVIKELNKLKYLSYLIVKENKNGNN